MKRELLLVIKIKSGAVGIAIIAIYIILGMAAPLISLHDPIKDLNLASDMAMPEWITLFPAYSKLPKNTVYNFDPKAWNIAIYSDNLYDVIITKYNTYMVINISRSGVINGSNAFIRNTILNATQQFRYEYDPPKDFLLRIYINYSLFGEDKYLFKILLITPDDKKYTLYDSGYIPAGVRSYWNNPILISSNSLALKELNNIPPKENAARIIFGNKGLYGIIFVIEAESSTSASYLVGNSYVLLNISLIQIQIPGLVYGLLGTNYVGADVWSQFVWGIRQSLLVGTIASSVSVLLGVIFGLLIGYASRLAREIVILLVDTIYLIPLLPVLLITLAIIGRNILITSLIIGLFIWAGLAREIGNWILSLKERGYVEAAKALGASDVYIMIRHVLPFTVHLIIFSFIVRIPFAILLEAGLSILGFGDPFQPSWGKMINEALLGGGIISGAWWWVSPPVIGLVSLSAGFILLGYALDEVFNPRFRDLR